MGLRDGEGEREGVGEGDGEREGDEPKDRVAEGVGVGVGGRDGDALGEHEGCAASPAAAQIAQLAHGIGSATPAGQKAPTGQTATVPLGAPAGQK